MSKPSPVEPQAGGGNSFLLMLILIALVVIAVVALAGPFFAQFLNRLGLQF